MMATTCMVRIIYELLCLKNPQKSLGLAPSEPIYIVPVSARKELANKVVFGGMATKLAVIPFFKGKFEATKDEIRFKDKRIYITGGASNNAGVLGLNVICAMIDEGNFFGNSRADKSGAGGDHEDNAEIVYRALERRVKSRFQRAGVKGLIFLVSSKKSTNDFTERRIQQAIKTEDPGVFVRDYCFTGDTKISLMDGREVSLEELSKEYKHGEKFWVYSYDGTKVVPGLAHHPRLTKKNEPVLKITLDNGESIRCTSNHKWMLRDGSYCEASDLKIGDSLMPLYRRVEQKRKGLLSGYEEFFDVNKSKWIFTHRMSAKNYYKRGYYAKEVIHHKDFNKRNNNPDNLQYMNIEEHIKLHKENMTALLEYVKSDKHRKYASEHIENIINLYDSGKTQKEIAKIYNCSQGLISQKIRGYKFNNHKIVSIEDGGSADVYDLSVDGFHNFALSAGVFVHNSSWEVTPDYYKDQKWHKIVVSPEGGKSRILDEAEPKPDTGLVIDFPDDFLLQAQEDPDGFIRDIAGIAMDSVSPFIVNREAIDKMMDKRILKMFKRDEWRTDTPLNIQWDNFMVLDVHDEPIPACCPNAIRHVHLDMSKKWDATGFCCGHIGGIIQEVRVDDNGEEYIESVPVIHIDGLLRVLPPTDGEIDHKKVRSIIYYLMQGGMPIKSVSMDQWCAPPNLQLLSKKGLKTQELSVEKLKSSLLLRSCIYENRVRIGYYDVLRKELRELELSKNGKKIDHPYKGSKDLADAFTGVLVYLSEKANHWGAPILPSKGVSAQPNSGSRAIPTGDGSFIWTDEKPMTGPSKGDDLPSWIVI